MRQGNPMIETKPEATRVAVIGAGYWGTNYIRIFSEFGDARVVAVCDSRADRLDAVRSSLPVRVTDDAAEAATMPEADAVAIVTDASTHRHLAGMALEAGKHVLVEKPLTTTSKDASELIDLAERGGKTLMVGHTFLYNPGVQAVKEYLDAGAVGEVYYLYSQRTSLGPIRSDVNAIWDLAPHDIAILDYLLGSTPAWVSAVGANPVRHSLEDVGFITLGYPGGIIGHIHVSWADPNKVRQVVVVGSEKRVVFNDMDSLERVRIFEKGVKSVDGHNAARYGEHTLHLRDGAITSPLIPALEPLKNQCGAFIHAIRGREAPITDGAQGREVVRVLEAVDKSVALQGGPVPILAAAPDDSADLAAAASQDGELEGVLGERSRAVR
jgi:predicted dehydrogenase